MTTLRRYERGADKDWDADERAAWGTGAAHEAFRGLEADLNEFSLLCGFDKLDAAGTLGDRTVEAFRKVLDAVLRRDPTVAPTEFPVPERPEDLATHAAFVRAWLTTVAAEVLAPAPASS